MTSALVDGSPKIRKSPTAPAPVPAAASGGRHGRIDDLHCGLGGESGLRIGPNGAFQHGFIDFDPDQNFQIEGHYQSCKSRVKPYGARFKLIGDFNMVKSGWMYEVWGTSEDPSTWLEQNITLLAKGQ